MSENLDRRTGDPNIDRDLAGRQATRDRRILERTVDRLARRVTEIEGTP